MINSSVVNSTKTFHGNKENSLVKISYVLFLFFLPFTQALTINILFPLKISEIALILLLFNCVMHNPKIPTSKIWYRVYLFIATVFISFVVSLLKSYPYPLSLELTRLSPLLDGLFKCFYLILATFALSTTIRINLFHERYLKYFFYGAVSASVYCWYLFLSGMFHIPVLLLPGMEESPQMIDTPLGSFIRCGTAKEGNFMGLFLLLSGIIANHFNKVTISRILFATILTTFSTMAFLCLIAYFGLFALFNKKYSRKRKALALSVFLVFSVGFLFFSEVGRTIVLNKLFGTEDTVENQNDLYSKMDRLNSTDVGLEMFYDNVFFGVGVSNYGIHHNHYNKLPIFHSEFKRIPNNIYIEILSESGLIAFVFFMLFIFEIFKLSKKNLNSHLMIGLLLCFFYFFAFPTYTMIFIWFFFGIIISNAKSMENFKESNLNVELFPM